MFQRDEEDEQTRLLVIQCDSGYLNGDLIACARYRIYDERVNALNKNKIQNRDGVTHILFIINLPHQVSSSTFVGFQGNPWISSHIDDLRPTSSDTIEPLHAIATNISELFIGEYIHDIAPLLEGTLAEVAPYLLQTFQEKEDEESCTKLEIHPTAQKLGMRQTPSGQCRRLYGCIQAAASRFEDSTKDRSTQRVTHLTQLIQRSPKHLGK